MSSDKESSSPAEHVNPNERLADGPGYDVVHIGNTVVSRREFVEAFKEIVKQEQLVAAPSGIRFANPAPLGLCGFALTTFVLSLINVHTRHVTTPNIVVGLAFFYGGLGQLLAGLLEFFNGNTFGTAAFSSYGCFWLSFAAIYTPSFGIIVAYDTPAALNSAVGFFLTGWFIFTFILVVVSIRTTVQNFLLFFFLDLTFLLLACGSYTDKIPVTKAGGWFGIITAFIAFYNAFCGLATVENSYWNVPVFKMPFAVRD